MNPVFFRYFLHHGNRPQILSGHGVTPNALSQPWSGRSFNAAVNKPASLPIRLHVVM